MYLANNASGSRIGETVRNGGGSKGEGGRPLMERASAANNGALKEKDSWTFFFFFFHDLGGGQTCNAHIFELPVTNWLRLETSTELGSSDR